MASVKHLLLNFHLLTIITCCVSQKQIPQPYVIYMGSSSNFKGVDELHHLDLLESLIPSEESGRKLVLNSYNHALKGFSAILTENEASVLSGYEGIVSVFPDPVLKLHTTRSWDFLEVADTKLGSSYPSAKDPADVIIGIIDTGIWPESPSFDDDGIGNIPSKWKGVCMKGPDFKKSNCNKKLIGARFYPINDPSSSTKLNETNPAQSEGSPRDLVGHGTHTSSIAGGKSVLNASYYYNLAHGTARGGLTSARIASYKACTSDGCPGSIILKAIDDAVRDGVDIISISIGLSSVFQSDFLNDPIAIGAFHAEENGVMVVCSGGNDGPEPYTIVNTAPWTFTVGASTIDREFTSSVVLGNDESYEGIAINFSPLRLGTKYPIAFGEQVASRFTPATDASNCIPGSLDRNKTAGKIIVCLNDQPTVSRRIKKLVVEDADAKGVIIINGIEGNAPFDSGTYPYTEVGKDIGYRILRYINSTKNPVAAILPSKEINKFKPAPVVASFSSRGPNSLTENILKPDITAPGVAILAAVVPKIDDYYSAPGNKPSKFGIKSGTSMACPHVTGAMAFIKSIRPQWSFSVIKSALMTTASMSNNMGQTLTNSSQSSANPHEVGAGEINPVKALDPGLAFKTTINDHLIFLCHYGYDNKVIRSMTKKNFTCPKNSNEDLISSVNYPSISIGRLSKNEGPKMVKRVATNVGYSPNATYVSTVNAPRGLKVKVLPETIRFREGVRRSSFRVLFDGREASKGYKFGDVRWFDGSHVVRVVFVVNVV